MTHLLTLKIKFMFELRDIAVLELCIIYMQNPFIHTHIKLFIKIKI